MFFYDDSHIEISSHNSWILVTFPSEDIIMFMRASRLNAHIDQFLFLYHFFSTTLFTSVLLVHNLSSCFTLCTMLLTLCIHTWTKLNKFLNYFFSFAFGTNLNIFSSFSLTFLTCSKSFVGYTFHCPIIYLF